MRRGLTGDFSIQKAGGEEVRAFVPHPLPAVSSLMLDAGLRDTLDRALVALGRLDSVSTLLPDTHLFLYSYVRKEAVLSSQIEGTQSSLSDLLLFEMEEAPGVPIDDVVEVSNYVAALEHGLKRVREGLPLSNRLLREIHEVLLARGRGAERSPGEFRRSQNWIGGTRPGNAAFVPPPPDRVADCMADLEKYLNDQPERTPTLLKAGLAHVQFETIHPFLDGNGRVGRLLVTLLLRVEGVLREPLLYLSLYLKRNRDRYYALLDQVRSDGDWEAWLQFFADAVLETAEGAVAAARAMTKLFAADHERIRSLKRGAGSALRVHLALEARPLVSISHLSRTTGVSIPTVTTALERLADLGIVREITGRRRNRVFSYKGYLKLLEKER